MYDDDMMLPDGYREGMSLEEYDQAIGNTAEAATVPPEDSAGAAPATEPPAPATEQGTPAAETEQPEADSLAPATGQSQPKPGPSETQAPAAGPEGDAGRSFKFTTKVDRNDVEVELKESDIPELYQRAQNQLKAQQRLTAAQPDLDLARRAREAAQRLGYNSAEEMFTGIDSRLRESTVEELTREGMGQKGAELLAEMRYGARPDAAAQAVPAGNAAPAPAASRDFGADIKALREVYPETADLVTLPDEVMRACAVDGKPLVTAYGQWKLGQAEAESARLRRENEVLKQNAANAAAAPVRGVSDGGATRQEPVDDFLKGFLSYGE